MGVAVVPVVAAAVLVVAAVPVAEVPVVVVVGEQAGQVAGAEASGGHSACSARVAGPDLATAAEVRGPALLVEGRSAWGRQAVAGTGRAASLPGTQNWMAAAAASSLELQAVGHSASLVLAGYGAAVRGGVSVRVRLGIAEAAIEELVVAAAACETGRG